VVSVLQAVLPDGEALARVCQERGVARLRVFGSVTGDSFDPERSDLDFLVDFIPERPDILGDFFGLQEDLSRLTGRSVDLVISEAVTNPYFRASVLSTAEDVYAA